MILPRSVNESQEQLGQQPILVLGLLVLLVTTSQFWFEFLRDGIRELSGYEVIPAWLLLVIAIILSVIVLLVYKFNEVPLVLLT